MKIIFGTGNIAKLKAMKDELKNLDIDLLGLKDLGDSWPDIEESGRDPLENARIKAHAYYDIVHMPVFSCDSGLYIEGLEDDLQPGIHVRNVQGKRLTDDEMIEYYGNIANKHGGTCVARYQNAICFVKSKTEVYEYYGEEIWGEKFMLSAIPHPLREEGFPLNSLSIHMESGKYYNDLKKSLKPNKKNGFETFFKGILQ